MMDFYKIKNMKKFKMAGSYYYMDLIRNKPVLVTPEETVRQKLLYYIINDLKVPKALIKVEERLSHYGVDTDDRADIIIEGYKEKENTVEPVVVIECKAEDIFLSEDAQNQMFGYADRLNTVYSVLTNGNESQCYFYDEKKDEYLPIVSLPDYEGMMKNEYDLLEEREQAPRLTLEEIKNHPYAYEEIGDDTPKDKAMMCVNLWECLLYTDSSLPTGKYDLFQVIEDEGVRGLRVGNASGGIFEGAYRSFYIKYKGERELVSIGLSNYCTWANMDITKTAVNIAIERGGEKPHHSLQLVVDDNAYINDNKISFYHHGRIAVGNKGSGKISELQELVLKKYPKIYNMESGSKRFYLGTLTFDRLWRLDDSEIMTLIENIISYALIRDDFREKIKNKIKRKSKK